MKMFLTRLGFSSQMVITGDITISVAGVDLLYVGLRGLVCAIDAMGELPQSLSHHPRPDMVARGMQ
jgi:phosphate starvation-inducible protein PhoH